MIDREHEEGMTSQDHEKQEWHKSDVVLGTIAIIVGGLMLGACLYCPSAIR